ncbi:MAG: TlpA family protein disulfide reductase [Pedobacter sp.]|nr:MAG: TlpA family protein disulfide reductase [Pedobacter sp.]
MQKKEMLTRKNLVNGLFFAVFLTIILVPSAKALVMQGLMEIGLFRPNITHKKHITPTSSAAVTFRDSKGNTVSLSDLKGKVVFLNFWATWCPPCLAEMPSVNKLYLKFGKDKDVVFLLIDADGDFKKAQAYMARKNFKLPVYTFESAVPEQLFSGSLPTTIVFDKMGRISYNESGAANYASTKFIAFIEQLKTQKD